MTGIGTVITACNKRDEIVSEIELYEQELKQAKADQSHVLAAISVFEASGDTVAIAEDQNRPGGGARNVLGTKRQHQRFA